MREYKVSIGTGTAFLHTETVLVEDFECSRDALDKAVDTLEERGETGFFISDEEIDKEGLGEDEYLVAGNHCLNLIHYGNMSIDFVREVTDN